MSASNRYPKVGERVSLEIRRRMTYRPDRPAEVVYVPYYRNVHIIHDCKESLARTLQMTAIVYPLDDQSIQELGLQRYDKESAFYYIVNDVYKCGKPTPDWYRAKPVSHE
jgi:hypothetical protein